jgi:hypothetical protein
VPTDPIDAELGGAGSNSYVTLEEAEAYFAARLNADAWDAASESLQQKALLTACRAIEACRISINRPRYDYGAGLSQLEYDPLAPYQVTQRLSFPRQRDRDMAGTYMIPQAVRDAQCEEAIALLEIGNQDARRAALRAEGVRSFSIDGLSETYVDAEPASTGLSSPAARDMIAPYLRRGGTIATSDNPQGEWTPASSR